MGFKERTTRSAPCIFCGDIGYDMRVHYPETEDVVHWCHKTHANKGERKSVDGYDYICISTDHETKEATMGKFDLWKKYLPKEEWLEKQERLNPDRKTFTSSQKLYTALNSSSHPKPVECIIPKADELLVGEEPVLSNKELNIRYRALLSMLVLEVKHKMPLLNEWKSPIYDVSNNLDEFLIRSLPPTDKARFKSDYQYKNPTRKTIIKKMFSLFGTLKGIPGFYMRSGKYWDEKPEEERWTFAFSHEAVIYPCFDFKGNIYGLRVKDELPDLVIKEGKHEPYKGLYGYFQRYYDNEGYLKCRFVPKEGNPVEVNLNDAYGKPRGKYKTFASVSEKLDKGIVINSLKHGSRRGTPYSLYTRPDDNFMIVIGTEGEKKAMVANAIKRVPCISIPGVTCFNIVFKQNEDGVSLIDYLKTKGMKYFILCYDADKEDNSMVYEAEQQFIKALREHDVIPMIGSWKQDFDKGLDDILLKGIEMVISPA